VDVAAVLSDGAALLRPKVAEWISRKNVVRARLSPSRLFISSPGFTSATSSSPCSRRTETPLFSPAHKLHFDHRAGDCGERRALSPQCEFKESILAAISKTMTGVYIVHYSVFHLLTALSR
jgi:hypothetical protein